MYLASSNIVVSSMIFTENEEKPILCKSEKLTGAKMKYRKHEKVALALVHSIKRLNPYFKGRLVKVYIEYPLRKVMENTQEYGRLT